MRFTEENSKPRKNDPNSDLPDYYDAALADQVSDHYRTNETKQENALVTEQPDRRSKKKKSFPWLLAAILVILVFFTPIRTTILVLGIDARPGSEWVGRSDTMIVTTIPPFLPQVHLVSIPRDLWVSIPGYADNRINTAHFFAEATKAGSGSKAAAQAVEVNFHIKVPYTIRLRFDGFKEVVDAMGGVTVNLPTAMSGLDAGKHHLDGTQALAFVRDRETSDDFYRQMRGQLFIAAAFKQMLNPLNWARIPSVIAAAAKSIQTNLPVWLWPRVGYSLMFSAVKGFQSNSITREMVTPFVTNEGAQVLLPNWDRINPMIHTVFR